MELWDTVTNEIIEVDHPTGLEDITILDPSITSFRDDSIILTNGSPLAEIFEYKIDVGWTKLIDSPTAVSGSYDNGLYLLNDNSLEGFNNLNKCLS